MIAIKDSQLHPTGSETKTHKRLLRNISFIVLAIVLCYSIWYVAKPSLFAPSFYRWLMPTGWILVVITQALYGPPNPRRWTAGRQYGYLTWYFLGVTFGWLLAAVIHTWA